MDASGFVVCGRCFDLRETAEAALVQQCDCSPSEPWPDHDLSRSLELCRCCGLVALPSGSRWSMWFCEACKAQVRALNQAAGRAVVPIGRHSLMNGVGLGGGEAGDAMAVASFAEDLSRLFMSQNDTRAWAKIRIKHNLDAIRAKAGVDVPLRDYLHCVQEERLDAAAAFREMLQWLP